MCGTLMQASVHHFKVEILIMVRTLFFEFCSVSGIRLTFKPRFSSQVGKIRAMRENHKITEFYEKKLTSDADRYQIRIAS